MTALSGAPPVALSTLRIVVTVCLPFACGYFLSYLYRSVNAVIADDLVHEFGLSATDLGVLTAAYFLTFGGFQIPLGLLLDRFGPRRVQAVLMLSAAAGAAVFAFGQDMATLAAGRALIGLGVAGGLMCSFKAIVLWFPPARWPLANGCFLAAGGFGALAATAPVEMLLGVVDWRTLFLGLAAINLCVCAAIWLVVPERGGGTTETGGVRAALAGLAVILRDRLFWRIAPSGVFTMAAGMATQTLWAAPWLRDVAGLNPVAVANQLFVLASLLIVGFVGTGLVADRLSRRGVSLEAMIGWAIFLFIVTELPLVFGWPAAKLLVWLGVGILANSTVLAYPLLSGHFEARLSGRATTALNAVVFCGAFGLQAGIGWVIDLWPPVAEGRYDPQAYRWAFGLVLAMATLSWLWDLVPHRRRPVRTVG